MHTHSSSCDCNNFNIGKIVFARLIYLTIFWFHLWTNKNKNEITFVGAIRWACSLCKLFRFVSIRYVYRIFFFIFRFDCPCLNIRTIIICLFTRNFSASLFAGDLVMYWTFFLSMEFILVVVLFSCVVWCVCVSILLLHQNHIIHI